MLERQWATTADRRNARGEPAADFIAFADVTAFIRRHILLVLSFPLLGILVAGFYIATTDPIFTARTQILIEPKIPQLLQQQASDVNLSLDTAQVETQLAVLRSEKIASMVIDELGLIDNPAFKPLTGPSLSERVSRIWSLAHGIYGDRAAALGVRLGSPSQNPERLEQLPEFERTRRAVDTFREGLGVQRVGVSYAIDIAFQFSDPELAARIADATAQAFVREQLETRAAAAREGVKWLEKRIEELRNQMNRATQIAQEFRARHDYRIGTHIGDANENAQLGVSAEAGARPQGPTLEELEVTADTYRKMYESLLAAFTSSVNQQPYLIADARVITAATRPLRASHPREKLVLALGALGGLMLGIGLAFARHTLDRTIRTPRQVREELGFDCLGELPPAGFLGGVGQLDEVLRRPDSLFSASLRSAKAAINLAVAAHPLRCIGITSAAPGDGKSTVASNLAALYASSGNRTLVIDADVVHSALTRGLAHSAGSAVENNQGIEQVKGHTVTVTGQQYELLPSSASGAHRLFAPKNMEGLLAEFDSYEIIIVDLPPFTSSVEWLAVAPLLDGLIIVVEWGKTPLDLVIELSRLLQSTRTSVVGVLMTKVRTLSTRRYSKRAGQTPR